MITGTPEAAIIGAVTSIVTELLKYVPFLNKNSLTRSLTSIVLLVIGNFVVAGKFSLEVFLQSLVFALTTYKLIVQPVADTTGMKTQK